jgi:hypothetical protein
MIPVLKIPGVASMAFARLSTWPEILLPVTLTPSRAVLRDKFAVILASVLQTWLLVMLLTLLSRTPLVAPAGKSNAVRTDPAKMMRINVSLVTAA